MSKNPHAVALGRKGGQAGKGESKRRNMKEIARLGGLARQAKLRREKAAQ